MTKVYDYYSRMSKNNRIPKPYTGVKCRYKKSSDHDPFDLGWLSRRTVEDFRVTRQISSATIREYITLYPKQAIKYIEKYPSTAEDSGIKNARCLIIPSKLNAHYCIHLHSCMQKIH